MLLLDLWAYPLNKKELKQGLKSSTDNIPCLSIYSEEFEISNEAPLTKKLVKRSNGEHGFVVGTCHQTFSDAAGWFPEFIGKMLGSQGATPLAEARHEILAWSLRSLLLTGVDKATLPRTGAHVVVTQCRKEQRSLE